MSVFLLFKSNRALFITFNIYYMSYIIINFGQIYMRPSQIDSIKTYMKGKGACATDDLKSKFNIGHAALYLYLKQLKALHSYNYRKQYVVLPEEHEFDNRGLLFFGDIGFFQEGSLLAAICHLVEISEQGLGARELDKELCTSTHSQLTKLYRQGRLERLPALGRQGNAYMYFSADQQKRKQQQNYQESKAEEAIPKDLNMQDLPDVIEVLLTLIAHPDFSVKSIALSLQRRGRKIGLDFVKKVFDRHDLSKKNHKFTVPTLPNARNASRNQNFGTCEKTAHQTRERDRFQKQKKIHP